MADQTGNTYPALYVPGFVPNLSLLPQQTNSRILPHTDVDLAYAKEGQFFNADDVGTTNPQAVTARAPATPAKFIDNYRRFGQFTPYADGLLIDNEDEARMLEDPTNLNMRALMAGQARFRDLALISAAFGPYWYQQAANGANNAYMQGPTLAAIGTQVVPYNSTFAHSAETLVQRPDGGYGLSIGKLMQAKSLLDNSEIDEEEPGDKPSNYYFVATAAQLQDLLASVPASNSFYNDVQGLVSGTLNYFMGFNFIRLPATAKYNPLPKQTAADSINGGTAPTDYVRQCFAFHKRALVYRSRAIKNAQVIQRPDLSMRWNAFYEADHGALRRYDTGVVEVDCSETNNTPYN